MSCRSSTSACSRNDTTNSSLSGPGDIAASAVLQPRAVAVYPHLMSNFPGSCRLANALVILAAAISLIGCAGPPPKLFPVTPIKLEVDSSSATRREYDTDGNGEVDFIETLAARGGVSELRTHEPGNGWTALDWQPDRPASATNARQILIIVDSVPFHMVREAWESGRFRAFHPPVRTIAPFPVMTDLSLSEFFGCSPCPGVESAYFDGRRLRDGYETYAQGGNVPWHQFVDYWMNMTAHAFAYLWPDAWFDHELGEIQVAFTQSTQRRFTGYCVGTSALGALQGRNGHARALVQLDRFCQWIIRREQGRVHITLMSDHGHNLMLSKRIPLPETLGRMGYRISDRLKKPGDVVVPEFGIVTCAALSTREPDRVSRDVVSIDGIRLAAYLDAAHDEVIVIARDGEARIGRDADGRFSYRAQRGDPLQLLPIIADMQRGASGTEVPVLDDGMLRNATMTHVYPDALHRLWRAFHGLVKNTPDVLIDVEDGFHCGSPFMSKTIDLAAAHGNLGQLSTSGFCMTTAGQLPPDLRMDELANALKTLGFDVWRAGN